MTDDRQQRVSERARQLEAAARQAGHLVTGDGRVGERAAAELLGVAACTLRRWRAAGEGPDVFRLGGRISYALNSLAELVENQRTTAAEFCEELDRRANVSKREQARAAAPSATAGSGAGSALTDRLLEHHQ